MSTATKKKKPEQLTFEQVSEKKLRDNLERYRGYVHRAAAGEFLDEDELEEVTGLLVQLRLPDLAWKKHQEAIRENQAAAELRQQIENATPEKESRVKQLLAEIEQLEKQLEQKRHDVHGLQRGQTRLIDAMRKQNELRVLYPDVVGSLDNAVQRRLEARQTLTARYRDKPTGSVEDGWSAT